MSLVMQDMALLALLVLVVQVDLSRFKDLVLSAHLVLSIHLLHHLEVLLALPVWEVALQFLEQVLVLQLVGRCALECLNT